MNKIYDFETEATKQVDIGAFDTQNISPDLELLKRQKERERLARLEQLRTPNQKQQSAYVEDYISQPQEVIEIEDDFDDTFSSRNQKERAADRALNTEMKLNESLNKKKVNWMGLLFLAISVMLAGSLVFVSFKYFSQVSETSKMKHTVQEAEEIKKNSNSKIETLQKQKEDIQVKLDESLKEKEELQKKLDEAVAASAAKQGQLDAANKANADLQAKAAEVDKRTAELQKQIDAIKKAAGA
ncbi:MAG: hypothetical protein ACRCV7_04260 [Culicoidibacterales bacterium]